MLKCLEMTRRWGVIAIVATAMSLAACGDATDSNNSGSNNGTSNESLEVEGSWVSNYGSAFDIDDESWGDQAVVDYDNAENFAVTQGEDAEGATVFNKLVWTEPSDGSWWYCTVDFGLETKDAALNTDKTADDSSPSESGCGGFAWTQMRVPIELTGTYQTQFESTETITATTWEFGISTTIVNWDNEANWTVTQNPEDAEFDPEAYNKIVWTEPDAEGGFYYCTVDFGLETEEAARNSEAAADDSSPEEGGCGQSPWTKMTPTGG